MNHATREIERGLCTGDERSRKDNCASRLSRARARQRSRSTQEREQVENVCCVLSTVLARRREAEAWEGEGGRIRQGVDDPRREVEEVEEGRTNGISRPRAGCRDAAGISRRNQDGPLEEGTFQRERAAGGRRAGKTRPSFLLLS